MLFAHGSQHDRALGRMGPLKGRSLHGLLLCMWRVMLQGRKYPQLCSGCAYRLYPSSLSCMSRADCCVAQQVKYAWLGGMLARVATTHALITWPLPSGTTPAYLFLNVQVVPAVVIGIGAM